MDAHVLNTRAKSNHQYSVDFSEEPTNEQLAYQYYTIIEGESTEEQENLDNSVLCVTFNDNIVEVANDPSCNETYESLEAVNNLELSVGGHNIEYDRGKFLRTSSVDDEHFDAIEPNLISLNCNEQDSNVEPYFDETNADVNLQLLEYSDESNTIYNIFEDNCQSEIELGQETRKFKCIYDGCDKVYSTSYNLSAHMRTHGNPKLFDCPIEGCDKKFSSSFIMKNHVKIHTGERPYICKSCSKGFKTSGELAKHAKIHTGIKPFSCPIEGCDRSFTTSNILKNHIRAHTGERPFICSYPGCGKAFTSSSNQKNHQRIHSGEKPFACTVEGCNKRFTEYSTMYRHMTSHQNRAYKLSSTCQSERK